MILTINGQRAALKKGSSIEYVSENRIFTDADDYSMEIELPLADCPQNLDIFGMITRKDVDTGDISLMRCLPWDISIGTQKRESPRAKYMVCGDSKIGSVIPLGFEPRAHSLEGCCSIQLSYGTFQRLV